MLDRMQVWLPGYAPKAGLVPASPRLRIDPETQSDNFLDDPGPLKSKILGPDFPCNLLCEARWQPECRVLLVLWKPYYTAR